MHQSKATRLVLMPSPGPKPGVVNRLKAGLAYLLAAVFMAYVRFCCRTSRLACTPEAEAVLSAPDGRPTILVFWHDEFMLLPLCSYFGPLPGTVCVANDTFGGLVMAAASRIGGSEPVIIGVQETREARIARITHSLLAHKRLAISAAYGQPWFKARPTSLQIASDCGGVVVAMHVDQKRRRLLRLGKWHAYLPVPFNTYVLHCSMPLQPSRAGQLDAKALQPLEDRLWGLRGAGAQRVVA